MNTWRLWHKLRYPLRRNVLYRWIWQEHHVKDKAKNDAKRAANWQTFVRGLSIFVGASLVLILAPVALLITMLIIFGLPIVLLVFNGTMLGLYWVNSITSSLVRYWRGGHRQLIGATPRGILGFSWIITTGCLHRGDLLRDAYRIIRWVFITVFILLLVVLFFIGLNLVNAPTHMGQIILLLDVLGIMAFVTVAWLDHIQSIVVASLIGLLAPTTITEQPHIRVASMLVFITLQIICYAIAGVLFFTIQNLAAFFMYGIVIQRLVVIILSLLVFYGLRELLITFLYRLVLRRYDSTSEEFHAVIS